MPAPNKACTGRLGLGAFFGVVSELGQFPVSEPVSPQPAVTQAVGQNIITMSYSEIFLSNLVGFILGIISSFISWWILFKNLRAKIKFSDSISKVKGINNLWVYRVKIANVSSRQAIDLSISARMCFPRLGTRKNSFFVRLPLDSSGETKVERFLINPGVENSIIIKILPDKTDAFMKSRFPSSVHEKLATNSLEFEDLFKIHPKTYFEIFVFATDNFSGTRSLTISKRYTRSDIKLGYFRHSSLEISTKSRETESYASSQDDDS